jgi:hypothetical protein
VKRRKAARQAPEQSSHTSWLLHVTKAQLNSRSATVEQNCRPQGLSLLNAFAVHNNRSHTALIATESFRAHLVVVWLLNLPCQLDHCDLKD